ncbi:uncharacterized [Tachysurus ichikawai]
MMAGSHSAEMYARFFAFKAGIDSLFLLVIVSLQAQSQNKSSWSVQIERVCTLCDPGCWQRTVAPRQEVRLEDGRILALCRPFPTLSRSGPSYFRHL